MLHKPLFMLLCITTVLLSQPISQEKVKAVFIEKFALFSEWPQEDSLFIFAILGESGVTDAIREIYTSRFIGKKIEIIDVTLSDSIPHCHILFIAHKEKSDLTTLLDTIAHRPILTISDQRGFGNVGVIINMYLERNQVRFEINKRALQESSLALSYKLMQMAKILEED